MTITISALTTEPPFVQLSSLQFLTLELLTCINVSEILFVGLDQLTNLLLITNRCTIDFSPLISLTTLSYQYKAPYNHAQIPNTLNSLNSSLQSLELWLRASYGRVNSTTFESLPKWKESLQNLTIGWTYIGGVDIVIEGSPFQWFPQLKRLQIQGYGATSSWTDPKNTFQGLASLKEVHLIELSIKDSLAASVLSTPVMSSLQVLNLAKNEIGDSNELWNMIHDMSTLETIDLSRRADNSFIYSFQLFSNKSNLRTLNLNHLAWGIIGLCQKIKVPNLFSFYSSKSAVYTCSNRALIQAPRLEELHLSGIELKVNKGDKWRNIPVIGVLSIFDEPQLKTLYLSDNQIEWIEEGDARRLSNVTHLDLSNNMLTSLSNLAHLYNIEVLLLGANHLYAVPMNLLSNNVLQILDLFDNRFVCNCSIERFQKWVLVDDITHLWNNGGGGYKCIEPYSGYSITELHLDCEVPLLMYISVSVTGGLVTIFAAILAVRYRWHIQYRIFLLFKRRAYLINDDDSDDDFEDEDGVPRYDAYVIYHDEDEDWVTEQLLANIEEDHEEQFKLCLKDRDMRAGRSIFNELSLHIQRSRKTLVILTPRFVDDNWCYFQLNMAHHRVLEESHNVLIFVILEEIPDNRLTLLLRQLFCKSQCLKWQNDNYGQNLFWRRLREELKRPVPRDLIHRYRRYNI